MSRNRRRYNAKKHKESLDLLHKVGERLDEIRQKASGEVPLFSLEEDEVEKGARSPEEKELVEKHNQNRNYMHFVNKWPWRDLPTAATALKAFRNWRSDPCNRAMMSANQEQP
ncbi:MAG: hypothetical protein WDZ74_00860 [Candidatus Paceibacterota bacterium]